MRISDWSSDVCSSDLWVSLIARATSSSKAQIRTGPPLAAATWATAVPHAPAPITPILMLSPPRHAPFLRPDQAASGPAPPHLAHPSIRQQTALRLPSLSWRRYPCIARVAVRQRVGHAQPPASPTRLEPPDWRQHPLQPLAR